MAPRGEEPSLPPAVGLRCISSLGESSLAFESLAPGKHQASPPPPLHLRRAGDCGGEGGGSLLWGGLRRAAKPASGGGAGWGAGWLAKRPGATWRVGTYFPGWHILLRKSRALSGTSRRRRGAEGSRAAARRVRSGCFGTGSRRGHSGCLQTRGAAAAASLAGRPPGCCRGAAEAAASRFWPRLPAGWR